MTPEEEATEILSAINCEDAEIVAVVAAALIAARVEGLREARGNVCVDCAQRIDRQIAALERGKGGS